MKIDLTRDPLFEKKQLPSKDLKDKQRQKHKLIRSLRVNPLHDRAEPNVEIIDPLPQQLHKYRNQIEYKKMFESSKASQRLKKYIIQQERNLKCVRLQKIQSDDQFQKSKMGRSAIKLNISNLTNSRSKEKDDKLKQINIPKIEQLFKNQQQQYVLFQSRLMRNQLTKAINSIDIGMNKLKSYSINPSTTSASMGVIDSRRNTSNDKFMNLGGTTGSLTNASDDDIEIDRVIQRKLMMSKKLREKLYKQKKEMLNYQNKESSQSRNMGFFLNIPKKAKKKVLLEGVKSITFCKEGQKLKITPASSLLFSLNKMSNGRQKKQLQLDGLIQNSYQNRESILSEKSTFYDQQSPFNNLSPSNQFKLRLLMDKKLMHRLQLSRQQINNFIAYLSEIKEYHVILGQTILEILKEVRQNLLSGKVMKISDFSAIVEKYPKNLLTGHPNELILQKLYDMMI